MKSVEEFSVRTLEVSGLGAALQALRLPYGKDARSYIRSSVDDSIVVDNNKSVRYQTTVSPDEKDITLIHSLIGNGDEHAKVLRGVVVWCEINAPRYRWQEMVTYRVGAECLSSESTMHVDCRGMNTEELIETKEHIEEGYMQKRILMISYQTLRRIYLQRKNHRLPQLGKFCEWICTLPYSCDFITF